MSPRERLATAAAYYAYTLDTDKEQAPKAFEGLIEAAKAIPREHDANAYQRAALHTEYTPLFVNDANGKPSEMLSRVMHAAMGMVTEAAEVIDMLKKHFIYGKEFDPINCVEEAGDSQWYAALLLAAIGFDFREAMERNIAKLRARYPDKFSATDALIRNLPAERAVLESKPFSKPFDMPMDSDKRRVIHGKGIRWCGFCGGCL